MDEFETLLTAAVIDFTVDHPEIGAAVEFECEAAVSGDVASRAYVAGQLERGYDMNRM